MSVVRSAAVDDVTVAELDRDPYPLYARLRAEAPVAWVPAVNLWMVTRWDDVQQVAKDEAGFTAVVESSPVERCFGSPTIITTDGPVHRELRRAIDPMYRPAKVNAYIDELVRPIAEDLLGALLPRGGAELLTEYFEPVSTLALARSMGFADEGVATLQAWFRGLAQGATNFEHDPVKQRTGDETAAAVRARADAVFDEVTQHPRDCALAHMLDHPRDFVMPTVLVTLLGGMQEPGHGAGSTLVGLLTHPEQWDAVREDRSLLLRAVDEGLRWVAPIGTQTRQAARDVEIGGAHIPAGDAVAAVVASACRDEARFADPDRFDIFRPEQDSAVFGFGGHYCSGHWFARHQIRIALEVLLERAPQLRPADGWVPSFVGWEFRAPTAVPVHWS